MFNFKVIPGSEDTPAVICTDVRELIEWVCEMRAVSTSDVVLKIGMDSGQGSLKAGLCLLTDEDFEQGTDYLCIFKSA